MFWYARKPTEDNSIWSDQAHLRDEVAFEADNLVEPPVLQASVVPNVSEQGGSAAEISSSVGSTDPKLSSGETHAVTAEGELVIPTTEAPPRSMAHQQTSAGKASMDVDVELSQGKASSVADRESTVASSQGTNASLLTGMERPGMQKGASNEL